ncbi:sensor histidine kinase [Planctomicrobium sp. SH527]|uniref:sensor histidine kinase n=1 Tax=Planctomicrobium sp. SH527 TaxID=3448123 RepID=UPI003F5B80B1
MANSSSQAEHDRLVRQYNEIAALAGGLAHEVRNPLSTIRLNLDLLSEELSALEHSNTHRMLRKLKTIQNECGHLESILEAFLLFARAGELTLEDSNISELIQNSLEVYKPLAEQYRIEVHPHLVADLPLIRVDRRLFRQLLDNLIRNAQQAMPQGGQLEIQTYRRDSNIVIEIIDTGNGIVPEAIPKIFGEFYSTKPGGSGLGLPTVRKIIEAHDGQIHCESEVGKGTRFTITLPIDTASDISTP